MNTKSEIIEAIDEGSFFDMQTFTTALIDLVVAGTIDKDVAADASTNRHDFELSVQQALRHRQAATNAAEAEEAAAAAAEEDAPPQNDDGSVSLRLAAS